MISWLKRLYLSFGLLLFSGATFAANSVMPTSPTFTPPADDLSYTFLNQIFGTVTGVLQGDGGQLLGKMFYWLNAGIVVVGAIWLGYTVFRTVLQSAQEGSFMGQNKNVAILMLRVGLGFAVLLPNPSTGYSLIQDVVMRVVVAGVGLADTTWSAALNYMKEGGSLFTIPKGNDATNDMNGLYGNLFQATQEASKAQANLTGTKIGQKILASEVCMLASNKAAKATQQQTNDGTQTNGNSNFISLYEQAPAKFSMVADEKTNTIYFPGNGNSVPYDVSKAKSDPPVCGSVTGTGGVSAGSVADGSSFQALETLAQDLMPAAKRVQDCIIGNESYCGTNPNQAIADDIFKAYLGYYNLIKPYARVTKDKSNKKATEILNRASHGWILAGRYYWNLYQANEAVTSAKVKNLIPEEDAVLNIDATNIDNFGDDIKLLNQRYAAIAPLAKNKLDEYLKTQNLGQGRADNTSNRESSKALSGVGGLGAALLGGILGKAVYDITNLIYDFVYPSANPMLFLMTVGQSCLQIAGDLWLAGISVIVVLGAVAGICNSTQPGGVLMNNAIQWIKPVAMGIAGLLLVPGMVLAYYVPLYPYVLFTFGAIGWLIMVIEAMVAAPLVAFGLTHPEGHDFLGKAEQAVMLFLGVFLRPVLMVIGLVAAMILSYVAMKLLLASFAGILGDISSWGSWKSQGITSVDISTAAFTAALRSSGIMMIIVYPTLLAMFAMLVYKVVQQCFSLIFVLPDNIMQWIGAPAKQDQTAQMAQQIEGITGSAGKGIGEQVGSAGIGTGEMLGRASTYRKDQDNKDAGTGVNTATGPDKKGGDPTGGAGGAGGVA